MVFKNLQYVLKKKEGAKQLSDFDPSSWFAEKNALDLPFPNLPYLIDHEKPLRLTQSGAIVA